MLMKNTELDTYCPDCKQLLEDLQCPSCATRFLRAAGGFPVLISKTAPQDAVREVVSSYDEIYENRSDVWLDQGRTPDFLRYFASLIARSAPESVLEIGCGEGFLLREVLCVRKSAIDVSVQALRKSSARTDANFAVAFAEQLPFPAGHFDLVYSVGVMEHFVDDRGASREVRRVLRPGGRYLVLIHVALSPIGKIRQKIREYVYPRPRPLALMSWLGSKMYRPIHQPIQHRYTRETAAQCLTGAGLVIRETITLNTHPEAPLVGHHVVIYDCIAPSS